MNSTWKLKGMLFFFHASMTIMVSYLPVYLQAMEFTGSQIGFLLAVGPAAAIIAQPFWGFMSDKWKTVKKILLICISGALAIGFIVFQIAEYLMLIPVMYLFFSFLAPAGGLGDSLAQKVSVKHSVSFGSIRMWGSLGFASASLAGGIVLSYIGIINIYYLFAFFLGIGFVFCSLAPDGEPAKKPVQLLNAFKLLKNVKLMLFLLMIMAISLTHRMNDSFLGLYIVELGGNESYIGLAWFIGVVAEAAVFAFSFYWLRKLHPLTLINIAAVLYLLRWILMTVVPDPSYVLYIQVLHGITFGIFYLTAFQFVTKLVPEELESTGHLLFISVFFGISGVIGSIIGGQVMNAFNLQVLYVVMAVLSAVGLLGSILYRISYFNSEDGRREKEKMKQSLT